MTTAHFQRIADLRAIERDHPLAKVDGADVPAGNLEVWLGPKVIGGRYFQLQIAGDVGRRPLLTGLHNSGPYPGMNWAEIIDLDVPDGIRGQEGWELRLADYLRPLADAIPAGGHLMIEYETEKWRATQQGLLAAIPPLATPLGGLLFELGCGSSFKDWYFPEGGQEGGRKLQGNRAVSPAQAREMAEARARELRAYIEGPLRGDAVIERLARRAAARILGELAG